MAGSFQATVFSGPRAASGPNDDFDDNSRGQKIAQIIWAQYQGMRKSGIEKAPMGGEAKIDER
jgi:hypothetical protein